MATSSKTNVLKTGTHELVKSYIEYDGTERMTTVYEAPASALNGAVALKTEYVYDGVSTRIIKMKESESQWNSTWDI
mgnify:CR=1 FL=1